MNLCTRPIFGSGTTWLRSVDEVRTVNRVFRGQNLESWRKIVLILVNWVFMCLLIQVTGRKKKDLEIVNSKIGDLSVRGLPVSDIVRLRQTGAVGEVHPRVI